MASAAQDPENRALPVEQLKALMRREKNKKMAAISRTKNVLHVTQLEDKVGFASFLGGDFIKGIEEEGLHLAATLCPQRASCFVSGTGWSSRVFM